MAAAEIPSSLRAVTFWYTAAETVTVTAFVIASWALLIAELVALAVAIVVVYPLERALSARGK